MRAVLSIASCGIPEILMKLMPVDTRALAKVLFFSLSIHPLAYAGAAPRATDALDWPEQKLSADNGAAQYGFGRAIAISGDTVFVAALNAPAGGAVYVFERTDAGWVQS